MNQLFKIVNQHIPLLYACIISISNIYAQNLNVRTPPFCQYLGVPNGITQNLELEFNREHLFHYNNNFISSYLNVNPLPLYTSALTSATFFTGGEGYQHLFITHRQDITNRLALAFGLDQNAFDGAYLYQSTNYNRLSLNIIYHDSLLTSYIKSGVRTAKLEASQSGGLVDNNTNLTSAINLANIETKLSNFTQLNRDREYFIEAYKKLSTEFTLTFSYKNNKSVLFNSDNNLASNYYDDYFINFNNPTKLNDSLILVNHIGDLLINAYSNDSTLKYCLGYEYGYNELNHWIDYTNQDLKIRGGSFYNSKVKYNVISKVKSGNLITNGWYGLSGFSKGNYNFELNYQKLNRALLLGTSFQSIQPDYIFFNGNDQLYGYRNTLLSELNWNQRIIINLFSFLIIHTENDLVKHYTYFDHLLNVNQTENWSSIQKVRTTVNKQFNKLGISSTLLFQNTNSDEILVSPFNAIVSGVYGLKLFKSNLPLNIELDAYYQSGYYGWGYSPVLRTSFQQNDFLIEETLQLDLGLSLELRNASIRAKLYRVNQGITDKGIKYSIASYPIINRMFVFGFNWRFFN